MISTAFLSTNRIYRVDTADFKFKVGGAIESGRWTGLAQARQGAHNYFPAHNIYLRMNVPALAEMCKPGDDSPTTINVQHEIFKNLL